MFLHGIGKRNTKSICDTGRIGGVMRKQGKSLNDQGFTLFELIIVVALIAILLGVATVGISGYFEAADQLERSEIAETSFYSIQSHVNYLERHGKLEEFEEDLRAYNSSAYGSEHILSESQNRSIVEVNYDGDGAAFYENEYYPEHKDSEIMYITLDKDRADSDHPMFDVLSSALDNDEAMENSFLVEYDLSTGVVRSVFYSEVANNLSYSFGGGTGDSSDCVYRDPNSLVDKKQGYYGVTFTAAEVELKAQELMVPVEVKLVNEDRLYLTWAEENTNNQSFMNGSMLYEELVYTVTLYDQNDDVVATYELPRVDMYEDITGTFAGTLDYIDDISEPVSDILAGSTKTARIGFSDLPYTEAPGGIAGQYYFLLLECLDHPFADSGYELAPEAVLYATVELAYGLDGGYSAEEIVESNEESAYYAHVEDELGAQEFGVACSRHLWNIRNGLYNGAYRLVADVDWANIENRARDIDFTSTQFADATIPGFYQSFEGTFTGEKTGEAAEGESFRYSNYRINGVSIFEEENERVGLFTLNNGTIENITLSNFVISGANKTGSLAGWNIGSMKNICVLDTSVKGTEEVGGLTGYNEGTIEGCTVTTGENRIIAQHTVGGVVGYAKNSVTDCQTACKVETILPEGTDKISTSKLGRYAGGVIGYLEAGVPATDLISGLLVDAATGLPMAQKATGADGGATIVDDGVSEGGEGTDDTTETTEGTVLLCSDVTAIAYMGGVIGEIEAGAGEYSNLANYAKLNVTYIDAEERTARSDSGTRMYVYYGGITGRLYEGNSLVNCTNYAVVALDFLKDGQPCDPAEIYTYVNKVPANNYFWNNPRYVGGITGHNKGTVQDCVSACDDYGTFEEALEEYQTVRSEGAYIGAYVGGLVGYNESDVVFTSALSDDVMQVVVKAFCFGNGGLVGYSTADGSIRNDSGMLTVQGVVASRGSDNPQQHQFVNAFESTGGVVGQIKGGEFTGQYTNDAYILGMNTGGITAYLAKGLSLTDCHNTGIIYGRGMLGNNDGGTGGIVGLNYGTLTECSNTGTVSGTHHMKDVPATSQDPASYMVCVGGVAGCNMGTVQNCHSKLNEEQDNYIASHSYSRMGGLIGYNYQSTGSSWPALVLTDKEEVVDIPLISGSVNYHNYQTKVGGIIGSATGILELEDFTYAGKMEVRKAGSQAHMGFGGIIGSMNSNTQILRNCTMKGEIYSKSNNVGGIVGIMTGGIIDDTNEVTKDAYIEGRTYTGGVVGLHNVTGTVSHIDIMENKATVVGNQYVGGIAGIVEQSPSIDLSNRKNSGKVSGVSYVGGVAGAYRTLDQTGYIGCQNLGEVEGKNYVGGIVGTLAAKNATEREIEYTIEEFVNEGIVRGNVTSSGQVGGLVGHNSRPVHYINCRNLGDIAPKEEEYTMSHVGGLVGLNSYNLKFTNCTNSGALTGYEMVGGLLGYSNVRDIVVEITDCINEKNGSIVATKSNIGGFVGSIGQAGVCELIMSNCKNYGTLDAPSNVGGLLGYSQYTRFEIENCHNYASIGANSKGKWKLSATGGLLGSVYVANGAFANEEESFLLDCTNNADIYEIGGTNVGGLIGAVRIPLFVENCSSGTEKQKYVINCTANATRVGGAIGYSESTLRMKNCITNMNITGDVNVTEAGGMIARATIFNIGEKDNPDTYCYSYGDITPTGTVTYGGGLVAYAQDNDFAIYGGGNYGKLGEKSTLVKQSGGLIGIIAMVYSKQAQGVIEDCSNLGQIYHAGISTGGLVGENQYHSLTLMNAHNGSEAEKNSGNIYVSTTNISKIGGLIGACSGGTKVEGVSRDLVMQTCNNYGDICFENTTGSIQYVGGLIGTTTHNTTIGEDGNKNAACNNYGEISGNGGIRVYYLGGIIGETRNTMGGVTKIYLSTNQIELGKDIYAALNTGGIVGLMSQNGVIKDCTNQGKLSNIVKYSTSNSGDGGVVGYTTATDLLVQNCVNGSVEDPEIGMLEALAAGEKIGGIIGGAAINGAEADNHIRIKDCINYANICVDGDSNYIGGVCGFKSGTGMLYIENSHNYGELFNAGSKAAYIGGLLGYGYEANVQIGAPLENGETDEALICVNYGTIHFENGCIADYIGGVMGRGKSVFLYGARNEADIVPDENGSVMSAAGGIAGYVLGTSHFQDLEQYGNLYHVIYDGNGAAASAGGLIGKLDGTAAMLRCYNGSADAASTGEDKGVIYAEKIENGRDLVSIGGLIGRTAATLTMEECINYSNICVDAEKVAYVGGICGSSAGEETYLACVNYGSITSNGVLKATGGLIGQFDTVNGSTTNHTVMGSMSDPSKACINFGDIVFNGTTVSERVSGFIGASYRNLEIYNAQNYGNIGIEDSTGWVNYTGGMIGEVVKNRTVVLQNCIQTGNIRRSKSYVGGMIGNMMGTAQIINCVNGKVDDEDTGNIYTIDAANYLGGMVGFSENLTVESCVNYADIIGSGSVNRAGGILGEGRNIVIGNVNDVAKGCQNHGDIYGEGSEAYLGGIVGYGTTSTSAVTIDIFDCVNTGSIAMGKYGSQSCGGIVGLITGTYYGNNGSYRFANTRIINCVNEGPILYGGVIEDTSKTYSGIGGIVGGLYSGAVNATGEIGGALIEGCTNNGTIAWQGFAPTNGSNFGGVAGSVSDTVKNCINNADVYAVLSKVGGIVGAASEYTTRVNVVECVNNGNITVIGKTSGVGGIFGYANARDYYGYGKNVQITDCTNYGNIQMETGKGHIYTGGIMGYISDSGTSESGLTILRCENHGNIDNGYSNVGGIVGATEGLDQYLVSGCINYGNIAISDQLIHSGAWQQYGLVGGISGTIGNHGGIMHCVNLGNVSGKTGRLGGLTGQFSGGYMVNCYNLGSASTTADERDGDIAGYLNYAGYLIDCYSIDSTNGKLYTAASAAVENDSHIIWQASNVNSNTDYYNQTSYESLCEVFGVESQWTGDALTDVLYLIANYKFDPDAPNVSDFVYTPAVRDEETGEVTTAATITWNIDADNYFASSGVEFALYESSMTDEEILADPERADAFFYTTVDFTTGKTPTSVTITFDEENLPEAETEYKIVVKFLGYSDSEGTVITEDSEWMVIQDSTLTLPAAPADEEEADASAMSLSDEAEESTEEDSSEDDGTVSGNEIPEEEETTESDEEEPTSEEETEIGEEDSEEGSENVEEETSSEEETETDVEETTSGEETVTEESTTEEETTVEEVETTSTEEETESIQIVFNETGWRVCVSRFSPNGDSQRVSTFGSNKVAGIAC